MWHLSAARVRVLHVEALDLLGQLRKPLAQLLVLAHAGERPCAGKRLRELLEPLDRLRPRFGPHRRPLVEEGLEDVTQHVLELCRVHQHEQQRLGLAPLVVRVRRR